MKKLLNGAWVFKERSAREWLDAQVPGCNYLDLMACGTIPDPFYGMNEKEVQWVADADWEYKRVFDISSGELAHEQINLVCEQLDTLCEVYVNGMLAGRGKNCHVRHTFDVKQLLHVGENELRIVFFSPVNYIRKAYARLKTPPNFNGTNGIPHIRKPQCHFGWDWGPVLPPSGITKDIYLAFLNSAKITDMRIEQTHAGGKVHLRVRADIDRFGKGDVQCHITVHSPGGEVLYTGDGEDITCDIEQPELWWTNDQSDKKEQPLYTVTAVLYEKSNELSRCEKKIGLRTLVLDRGNDEYGANFRFVLNGVPLFIKGANWIPPDSFVTRFDAKQLQYAIDAALFSNINMLRIWGGGYYGDDNLYDMCDKYGILIWQDFMFACQAYPFFEEQFLSNVKAEVADNVKRLRHHVSLALWCGNNEIEQMSVSWRPMRKYVRWTETFFYQILPAVIREHDAVTAYTPSSPCGNAHNKGFNSDDVGDTHLWAVWHGLQPMNYYRKRLTRFCSEFGFESLPDIKTVERFSSNEDYSLDSPVFTAHQKCFSGNMIMEYYILSRFRMPKNFVDFIYLSQITQQECISDATEHWRRNKGRCNGALYWQFNDCWPVCSWAGMDYYGNYKALQYTARRFNAPLSVSIEDSSEHARVFILNDKNRTFKTTVWYKIFDFTRGVLDEGKVTTTVQALENKETFVFSMPALLRKFDGKRTGLLAELLVDGQVVSRKTLLFDKEKHVDLPPCRLEKQVRVQNGKLEITVKTDHFARLVQLGSARSALPFSDNYFDLLPGEEITITQALYESLSVEEQINALTVFSCADVEPAGSAAEDRRRQIKIMARPSMFARRYLFNLLTQ